VYRWHGRRRCSSVVETRASREETARERDGEATMAARWLLEYRQENVRRTCHERAARPSRHAVDVHGVVRQKRSPSRHKPSVHKYVVVNVQPRHAVNCKLSTSLFSNAPHEER